MMKQKKVIRYLKSKTRPKYPANYERDYYRVLRAIVRKLKKATEDNLYIIDKALRNDDDIDTFASAIIEQLASEMPLAEAERHVNMVLSGVDRGVKTSVTKAFVDTCGVDVFLNDTQLLENVRKEWYSQQSRLINSMVSTYTEKLQTIISNAVQRGTTMKEVTQEIKDLYGITDKRAKLIARNEVGNLNGILTKQRQVDSGIRAYEWSTSRDERVRASHAELEGSLFWWNGDKLGEINGRKVYPAPKFHPGMDYNCRCVGIAVIDLENWNMMNAVPMGEIKPKATAEIKPVNTAVDLAKAEFDNIKFDIVQAHDKILTAGQRQELDRLLANITHEQLDFYQYYVKQAVARNDYHYKQGGFYRSYDRKAYMDIDGNIWEKKAGYKGSGAWKTKFHEEFHQIDHMMGNTELSAYLNSDLQARIMTNTMTVTGAKLSAAIEDDVVAFFNKAIKEYNDVGMVDPMKTIKTTARIPRNAKDAVKYYLKRHFTNDKEKAYISMLTDAIGLHTKGKSNPYGYGFWGHDNTYCKQRGKDGATSETWATFGSYLYAYDAETKKVIDALMPNTIQAYKEVFEQVMNYVRKNGIKYRS